MKDQGRLEIWPLPFPSLNLGSGLSLFNLRSRAETHGFLGNGPVPALDPSPALSLSLSPSADGPPVGESSQRGCPQSPSGRTDSTCPEKHLLLGENMLVEREETGRAVADSM